MSDIQFETDNQFKTVTSSSIGIVRAENKMAEWLMRRGVVRDEKRAQLVMLGIAGGAIAIAIAGWFWLNPSRPALPSQDEIDATMRIPVSSPAPNPAAPF
jgi:hypothetical protein